MEIFFDSPFMVLILIALFSISSALKKRSQKQNKTTGRHVEKKYTKPGSPFEEVKEIFKEVTRNLQEEQNKLPSQKPINISPERKIKSEQELELKLEQLDRIQSELDPHNHKKDITLPVHVKMNDMEINESKLIESVIWSEILGSPRSKKPYSKIRK